MQSTRENSPTFGSDGILPAMNGKPRLGLSHRLSSSNRHPIVWRLNGSRRYRDAFQGSARKLIHVGPRPITAQRTAKDSAQLALPNWVAARDLAVDAKFRSLIDFTLP